MSNIMSYLFETKAIRFCEENKPFWYTSGKIGPYFINTHFVYGNENDAKELLSFIDEQLADKMASPKNVFEKVIGMPVSYIIPFDPHNLYGAANLGQPCMTIDTPINDILHDLTSRILGNSINQKMHEVYEDGDILSVAGIQNILNKVGLDQILRKK